MTLHVCVLGIDGSGKSTVCRVLPRLLAAQLQCRAGSGGDDFAAVAPDEDVFLPGFEPYRPLLAVRLARWCRRQAKRHVNDRRRYPVYKLAQFVFQDSAASKLAQRFGLDVVATDGDLMLSVAGRAANYRRPASAGEDRGTTSPNAHDLALAYQYIFEGRQVPAEHAKNLPSLKFARRLFRLCRFVGNRAGLMPDIVLFLDLPPSKALLRIGQRGRSTDRHENLADLEQARQMYLRTLDAFAEFHPAAKIETIPVDESTLAQILERIMETVKSQLRAAQLNVGPGGRPLGTTAQRLTGAGLAAKLLRVPYILHYLVRHWFDGAWREPAFVLSQAGRRFLKLGYSAEVMRDIYDQKKGSQSFADRAFFEYPLHRAVYDRLEILVRRLVPIMEGCCRTGSSLSIFSAPSGFAYDVLGAITKLDAGVRAATKITFTAADLDPHGGVEPYIVEQSKLLDINLKFLRSDLTLDDARVRFAKNAPFDIALFVGLSSWLPKPHTLNHLRWLRSVIKVGGVLVTDCFTPAPYAQSGKYVGYKANYYEPDVYATLLDYCGFDGQPAGIHSGRDAINHVLIAKPRA